jgi:F-type H+-transporting ATPase subunit epsilon
MAEGTFQLRVFSGRGLEIESPVSSVTIPTEVGEVGILADHCEYVGLLATGIATYEVGATGSQKKCLVSGGLATFSNNVLTLLADTVDNPDNLDTTPLSEDLEVLKTQLQGLSLFDPQWEVVSQKVSRIEALKVLVNAASR